MALHGSRERTLVTVDGAVLCARCRIAKNPWTRMRGLLGRKRLDYGEGILLRPASSVHTFFMLFPIDVVFLDRDLSVLRVVPRRYSSLLQAHAMHAVSQQAIASIG